MVSIRAFILLLAAPTVSCRTVLVTGATGRTGATAYKALQQMPGIEVRALTRSADKARERLGCNKCDETEGIFIGDITNPETLVAPMQAVQTVLCAIGTPDPKNVVQMFKHWILHKFPKGQAPKDIEFLGAKNQIAALAQASIGAFEDRHFVLLSTGGTTNPNNLFDKISAHDFFYHLNGEAALMQSGLPFTIVQPCGLQDGPAGTHQLVWGHDDVWHSKHANFINREDVALVLAAAAAAPNETRGLRFDLCVSDTDAPSTDVHQLFKDAALPWDPRSAQVVL